MGRGTPFIEIDPEIVDYVAKQPDECVKKMFGRMVLSHNGLTAVFPIKRLSHSFIIGGFGVPPFDPAEEKRHNNTVRENLKRLKDKVMSFVEKSDASAMSKASHYLRALDEQLKVCDRTDDFIERLIRPFGRVMTKDDFPGLRS